MALEGTIKDFGLPDIFQLIGLQRKTGHLRLRNAQEEVTVTFEGGMVVMADSTAKRLEDRLGGVLVKQGKISRDRLADALQTQKQTAQRLGHILLSTGAIVAGDLKQAIELQVQQIVYRVFRWKEGEYHFAPADSVEYDKDTFTPLSADFILMEGIRMVDEWPIIEKKVPSFDLVFRSVVANALVETGSAEPGGLEEQLGDGAEARGPAKVRLTPDEHKVFRLVDGVNSVQAIVDGSGLGEFDTCRTLFDLLNRNIIATAGRSVTKDAGEEPAEARSGTPGWLLAAAAVLASVVGLVLHRGAPFGVLTQPALLADAAGEMRLAAAVSGLERVDAALLAFQLVHGRVPAALDELVSAGLLDSGNLRDPWGRPYEFVATAGGYRVSAPADPGTPQGRVIEREVAAGAP